MTMMTLFSCILIYFVVGIGIETNAQVLHRDSYYCLPKKCLKNQFFILCDSTNSAKPGKDECIPCKNGTFNLNEMDTSTLTYHLQVPEYEVCTKPDCNCGPEGLLVNGHNCNINGAQKICICNVNEGYCGDDYRNCDKWNKAESDIPVDWGLTQNCSIKKCEEGYSKPYVGYGACEEDTNKLTTTQPTTPFTTGASATDVQNNSTEVDNRNTTTPSVNKDKDGGLDLNILIIAVASLASLAVIILGVWLGIKLCCRNKFGQFIQRLKNTVPNNGVNDQLNEIPEEQNVNVASEATSMV
eukprot:XP_019929750.1 PREDICTED: uncharacterized protein LOC105345502 [Crassostrea gigas]